MIKVTVWNEFHHEKEREAAKKTYPNGIHAVLAEFLGKEEDFVVRTATLDDPECGLTQEVIDDTDVLLWWAHVKHQDVPDEVAERVQKAIIGGMGAIFLHSAHLSKPFTRLMGTTCTLAWHEKAESERLWVCAPGSPIVQGIGEYIDIPHEEMYGEHFDIPEPDRLVMIGWFETGSVFRSGCCFNRGNGKIFYFQPGHETYPVYYQPEIQTVIKNAVRWAAPERREMPDSRYRD